MSYELSLRVSLPQALEGFRVCPCQGQDLLQGTWPERCGVKAERSGLPGFCRGVGWFLPGGTRAGLALRVMLGEGTFFIL